jgi:hypothetical protein
MLVGSPAAADASPQVPRLVVIDSRLSGVLEFELEEALAELLGRLQLRIVGDGSANTDGVLAVVSIEPSDGGALVTVQETGAPHSRVRRGVERSESSALFRETLAHVILGAVEPMLRTAQANAEAQQAPPPPLPPEPAEPVEPPSGPSWGTEFFGSARGALGVRTGLWFAADGAPALALGVAARVRFDVSPEPSLALEGSYVLPSTVEQGGLSADFSRLSLRARPGVELGHVGEAALGLDVAAGVDFVALAPARNQEATFVEERSTRVQPMLGGALAARIPLSSALELMARLGLDVDLAPRRWLIEDGAETAAFFQTPRVFPHATLGFDWSPSGASSQEATP